MTVFHSVDGIELDDEHRVTRFRRFLEPTETRNKRIVQFWAQQGGLRTVDVRDIIDIR